MYPYDLDCIHHSWIKPFAKITMCIMSQTCSANDVGDNTAEDRGTLCIQLLPKIVRFIQLDPKRAGIKPVVFLRDCAESLDPSSVILNMAVAMLHRTIPMSELHTGRSVRPLSSEQKAVRSIHRLIREGKLNAATSKLEHLVDIDSSRHVSNSSNELHRNYMQTPVLSYEEYIAEIARLHPSANDMDRLPTLSPLVANLQLTADQVLSAARTIDKKSAAGSTGWSNRVLHTIMVHGTVDEQTTRSEIVCTLFNKMLNGSLRSKYWIVSRSVLIPKHSSDMTKVKWRPLGIGDAWYRLLGRAILKIVSKDVADSLMPYQYAVGVSCGTDKCANLAQTLLKKKGCIINVDVHNAFNSLRRNLILAGIRLYCPQLETLFYWAYESPSIMLNSKGEQVGTSETGVKQGDPLSGLYFCCGLQFVLINIASRIAQSAEVFSYSDDTNVACCCEEVIDTCHIITECFTDAHLSLVPEKCCVLCDASADIGPFPCPFPIVYTSVSGQGRLLVGNPIGGESYRTETLKLIASKHAKALKGLSKLRINEAFLLLKLCVNPRMVYSTRINHPKFSSEATVLFDDLINRALFRMCCSRDVSVDSLLDQITLGNIAILRALPLDLGGLAIMEHAGLVGQKGYISSFNSVRKCISKHFPYLEELLLTSNPPVRLGLPSLQTVDMPHIVTDEATLNSELLSIRNNVAREFHTSLLTRSEHPPHIFAAEASLYVSSIFEGSGSGFSCALGIVNNTDAPVFRECLRLRLLINPIIDMEPSPTTLLKCGCGKVLSDYQDGFHALSCPLCGPARTRRHTFIKKHLNTYFTSLLPSTVTVTEEPQCVVANHAKAGDLMISDTANGYQRVLDLVISDPTTVSNLSHRAFDEPDAVTAQSESLKLRSYRDTEWLRRGIFLPFAMTSTGKIGGCGLSFLQELKNRYELKDSFISELRSSLAWTCLKEMAGMVLQCRGGMHFSPNGTFVPVDIG
jgi:hypothetical protein